MTKLYNINQLKKTRRKLRSNMTDAEQKLWHKLRKHQIKNTRFLRQYSIDRFVVDFYCPKYKLAVELDGGQHNDPQKKEQDLHRTLFLKQFDIKLIRFWNNQVLTNIDQVVEEISNNINPS